MTIVFAIPSKGRLKDSSELLLAQAGLKLARAGAERGYRGHLEAIDDVEVAFISATEIAKSLRDGIVDCGITGEDVLREAVPAEVETIAIPLRLPFGNAQKRTRAGALSLLLSFRAASVIQTGCCTP